MNWTASGLVVGFGDYLKQSAHIENLPNRCSDLHDVINFKR